MTPRWWDQGRLDLDLEGVRATVRSMEMGIKAGAETGAEERRGEVE